jgi:hypothetical protein
MLELSKTQFPINLVYKSFADPTGLLFKGYIGYFPGVKGLRDECDHIWFRDSA